MLTKCWINSPDEYTLHQEVKFMGIQFYFMEIKWISQVIQLNQSLGMPLQRGCIAKLGLKNRRKFPNIYRIFFFQKLDRYDPIEKTFDIK